MQDLETVYQKWADEGNKRVITKSNSKEELDAKFFNFNSMPYDLRLRADEESIRLFGKTNKERYEEFNSYFLKKNNIKPNNGLDSDYISTNESVEYEIPKVLTYTDKEIIAAMRWMKESQKIIIIPTATEEELEKSWNEYNSMYKKHRRESDWKSLELFNMTNETHYNLLKTRFNRYDIQNNDNQIGTDVSISSASESFIEKELSYINSLDAVLDYDFIKESLNKLSDMSTSQYESILIENAYVNFNNENKNSEFINICETIKLSSDSRYANDTDNNIIYNILKPIYIVLIEGSSIFSKTVKKVTKGIFSHAAISFDSSLKNMYSFNINTTYGHDGLSNESIEKYPKDNMLGVFVIFVKEKQYENIKKSVNYYIDNSNKTHYAFSNLLPMIFNIPSSNDLKMVCSQFVDNILKLAKIDITNKDSSLVNPNDLYNAAKENKKIYIAYCDKTKLYNKNKVNNAIKNLLKRKKANAIVETAQIALPCLESKEFPAQFDKDGNLFIKSVKNIKNVDYCNSEFAKSHKLLLQYSKVKNIDGMKYEISKLWYMNNKIEYYMSKNDYNKKMYTDVRALILNDFNKYLSEILEYDKTFNFTEYYNQSPFSDDTIKINNSTLKYTIDMIKRIIK